MRKIGEGKLAASKIFAVIDRRPLIKKNPFGKRIENVRGIIRFENVSFAYPKDPNKLILNNVTLEMKPNETTALIGESGCGKSTLVQLLLRFYDPWLEV